MVLAMVIVIGTIVEVIVVWTMMTAVTVGAHFNTFAPVMVFVVLII